MRLRRAAAGGLALLLAAVAAFLILSLEVRQASPEGQIAGSGTCRPCHEEFYARWAPSRHGRAMQPFTAELAATLAPQQEEILVGGQRYHVELRGADSAVIETGPDGRKRYRIAHALGGKNVYYFLTPLERGRLQVLPVAYDVRRRAWYDTALSGVRHFPDRADSPLDWRERPFTFNTSCYSCHVSQLVTHYDPETDTYRTRWAEPGISCETCHGPGLEHVTLFEKTPSGAKPEDPRILRTSSFSPEQVNSLCAPCHAKMIPLSAEFRPGERFFDHYDLVTLEHPDYYPDGRDLGENYTYTSWRLSPCVKGGKLDCLHCHTSSGRYRFASPETANHACLPCHQDKVADPAAHSRHPATSPAGRCIACHMPATEFARMRRSDHSMLPPAPAATLRFGSPNACNLCHTDKDAAWADAWVRRWRKRDYQGEVLERASLIDAARKGDWSRLDAMLAHLARPGRDEIFAASLLRLLRRCERQEKWPAVLAALEDPSPLVRAAAAEALAGSNHPQRLQALLRAVGDEFRLVRVRAAAALGQVPESRLEAQDRRRVARAAAEFEASMRVRPDDPGSRVNLGNYYLGQGDLDRALAELETALKIDPRHVPALVNVSLAYNLAGRNDKAEGALRAALEIEPQSAAANFNLGLLLGELGRRAEAKQALERAWAADSTLAAAAYNLCVLEAPENLERALSWCRKAAETRPEEPRYAYTLAFYLSRGGALGQARAVLEDLTRRHPGYADGFRLLAEIHAAQGNEAAARETLRRARAR